jgi:hypothetical protein
LIHKFRDESPGSFEADGANYAIGSTDRARCRPKAFAELLQSLLDKFAGNVAQKTAVYCPMVRAIFSL